MISLFLLLMHMIMEIFQKVVIFQFGLRKTTHIGIKNLKILMRNFMSL